MNNEAGIYEIRNLVDGKRYIGSSKGVKRRIWEHKHYLEKGTHSNTYLSSAYREYGLQNFSFSVLEYVTEDVLIEREQHFMDTYSVCDREKGYNIATKAGSGGAYVKMGERHRALASKNKKGKGKKLNWELVKEIREKYNNQGLTQQELAKEYSVSFSTISSIVRNKIWVDENYKLSAAKKKTRLSWEIAKEIRELYSAGNITQKRIAAIYNVSYDTIHDIVNGNAWNEQKYTRKIVLQEQADQIRELYRDAAKSQAQIAAELNIPFSTVNKIINKLTKVRDDQDQRKKVTKENVEKIRRLYNEGAHTQKELGGIFGLTQTAVSAIIRNEIWRDEKYLPKRKRNKRSENV